MPIGLARRCVDYWWSTEGSVAILFSLAVPVVVGTIYLPNSNLKIDAKSDIAAESAYTAIVANRVDVKGANLVVNSDYGGTDAPVPEGVGPNSSQVTLDR